MGRTELIIGMTIVLFIAFGLGWFASWLVHRLTRVTQAAISDLDQMAHDLHAAQESLEEATTYFEHREARAGDPALPVRGRAAGRDGGAARCAVRGRGAEEIHRKGQRRRKVGRGRG